jgi:hypothetical protein
VSVPRRRIGEVERVRVEVRRPFDSAIPATVGRVTALPRRWSRSGIGRTARGVNEE